ncbi:hypothetical protein EWM64_g2147 [Hericium alpestre]|uniref:Glycoside hydrolase family 31 N-terminal domain-containing protein n=1 Tax=Hericium alpestre TaxID=135208 RepID=A0A4Z0A7F6_9AGAM|nr:hypothetical protein EWM64_g2147 [Hericium alpestre]
MAFVNILPLYLLVILSIDFARADYFSPNSTGIKLQNGFERVFIQPFGNHAFRVRASLMKDPVGTELSAFLDPPIEGPGGNVGLKVDQDIPYQGNATIRNGNLIADVALGVLSFYRVEPNGSRTLLTSEFTDDKALASRYYIQEFRASSFEAQFSFTSDLDEQFYGVGQQACCKDNSINKKGQTVDLINFNSQVPIPLFTSNKVGFAPESTWSYVHDLFYTGRQGYLMFFNFPGQGRIEFNQIKTRFVGEETTVVDYYITTAAPGDYDALQQQYTAVTGRQPTPPDFLLGYQQSKLRYYNQSQVIDVVQRFHDERIDLSMIVVDFFAWKYQGDWSFDSSLWPDPAGMAKQVKELTGAEMMVSLWPSVENLSENYLTLQRNGWLVTTRDGTGVTDSFAGVYTRLIDSTNPGARQFLWQRLNDSYFSKGIHNFWIDQADGGTLGEAYENNGQDDMHFIPYARAFAQYYIGTQTAAGKMYPWLHQQAIDEGLHNLTNTPSTATACKYMSLTRSTFAGGQRFCSYLWSGDTVSRFDVLLQQITSGVSAAASGISSWTLDIGGFTGLDVDSDYSGPRALRALVVDGCLPPLHASTWYISLRYQIVPYIKRLFQQLQESGRTIMRPLYYDFSLNDPFVANATRFNEPLVTHQFMLGPRILISPVGVQNATSKEVYLPRLNADQVLSNFSWTHWWSGKNYGQGGSTVNVSAPLDQIPVFFLGNKDDILSGNI